MNISLPKIVLGLIWGCILAPSEFKIEQKLPKMEHIIPNFLVLQIGENFMKIRTQIAKLQMQENSHKNVKENMQILMSFYDGQLKQQICFLSASNFPNFEGQNAFFHKFN